MKGGLATFDLRVGTDRHTTTTLKSQAFNLLRSHTSSRFLRHSLGASWLRSFPRNAEDCTTSPLEMCIPWPKVDMECTWQDGAEGDALPDPGELVLLTFTIRCVHDCSREFSNRPNFSDDGLTAYMCLYLILTLQGPRLLELRRPILIAFPSTLWRVGDILDWSQNRGNVVFPSLHSRVKIMMRYFISAGETDEE